MNTTTKLSRKFYSNLTYTPTIYGIHYQKFLTCLISGLMLSILLTIPFGWKGILAGLLLGFVGLNVCAYFDGRDQLQMQATQARFIPDEVTRYSMSQQEFHYK